MHYYFRTFYKENPSLHDEDVKFEDKTEYAVYYSHDSNRKKVDEKTKKPIGDWLKFEGLYIVFAKDEADAIEHLKGYFLEYITYQRMPRGLKIIKVEKNLDIPYNEDGTRKDGLIFGWEKLDLEKDTVICH